MKVTVMGVLGMIGCILLLTLILYGIGCAAEETGKRNDQPNLKQ